MTGGRGSAPSVSSPTSKTHDPSTKRTLATRILVPWAVKPSEVGSCLILKRVAGLFSARSSLSWARSSAAAAAGEASAITNDRPAVPLEPVVFWSSDALKPSPRMRLVSDAALGFPVAHEAALRVNVGAPLGEY